jgi:FlaA1/EpsC-like NDP-sugar epimerase
MGCSKRICEIYVQSLAKHVERTGQKSTQFITTRFGNVLGSNGSVIPLFREQIKHGGPVTVTHPEIIRYFMTIPEACQLVLEAGSFGKNGEIYIFDMGKPVKILDLAKRMIRLSGSKNVKIEFTGLRHGEKLYEELLNIAEHTKPTRHDKIMVAEVREYEYIEVSQKIDALIKTSYDYDDMRTVKKMKEIVPEFQSINSPFEAVDRLLEKMSKNGALSNK